MIISTIHDATEITAHTAGDASFFKIKTPHGHASVFCPPHVAQAVSDAFSTAMAREPETYRHNAECMV